MVFALFAIPWQDSNSGSLSSILEQTDILDRTANGPAWSRLYLLKELVTLRLTFKKTVRGLYSSKGKIIFFVKKTVVSWGLYQTKLSKSLYKFFMALVVTPLCNLWRYNRPNSNHQKNIDIRQIIAFGNFENYGDIANMKILISLFNSQNFLKIS